jgi:hypothetical protein
VCGERVPGKEMEHMKAIRKGPVRKRCERQGCWWGWVKYHRSHQKNSNTSCYELFFFFIVLGF